MVIQFRIPAIPFVIYQRMFLVPSTCPSRRLGGKIQRFAVNLQFFVSKHPTRTRSAWIKCATRCPEKGDLSGTSADSKCPNSSLWLESHGHRQKVVPRLP